eukprot:3113878-Prymnesium_polylepis.1
MSGLFQNKGGEDPAQVLQRRRGACLCVMDDIHVACLTFNFARIRCPLFPRSGSLSSMPMHSTFLSVAHWLRQMWNPAL